MTPADRARSDWREHFKRLDSGSPAITPQQRGREFEQVLHDMFADAGMDPRLRFRPPGEEIDGSFLYQHRPMLVEAKWTTDRMPASSLYQFRGKLDGKLTGTLGLFISMGGYSREAVDALVAGKSINMILFDGDDLRTLAADSTQLSIGAAIAFKIRAAAEEGTPLMSLTSLRTAARPIARTIFIVEGHYDAQILQSILAQVRIVAESVIVPAGSRLNLPRVALAVESTRLGAAANTLVLVADGDDMPRKIRQDITNTLASNGITPNDDRFKIIVVDPNLETALGIVKDSRRRPGPADLYGALHNLDFRTLAAGDPNLARLFGYLGIEY